MKKRVLFVDDDPSVLEGLSNVMFRDRTRWDMVFAGSGEQAFAALAVAPFDVVVSDMRMPGIDGVALLERVKSDSPRTARIMLSGSADEDEIDRAGNAVDELLGKPCDAKTLRAAIERWMTRSDG